MRIALSGGEKGSFRNILVANGVPRIAFNLTQYNIPKTKEVNLTDLLGGAEVFLYTSDGDEDEARFDEFVRTHGDELTAVIGRPGYNGEWLGDKYVPLWNDADDVERLAHLCQRYGRVAISDRAINPKTLPRIRQLQQRWNATLYGLTSKVDVIEAIDWDTVLVASWTSVVRYGETQIWDGHGLRRYPAQRKETARSQHRADIIRMGIDYEAVSAGDVTETAKMAVKSWLLWEQNSTGNGAYHPQNDDDEAEFDSNSEGADSNYTPSNVTSPNPVSTLPAIATDPPNPRHESEKLLLPVMGVERAVSSTSQVGPDGEELVDIQGKEVSTISYASSNLRNCNSCYLASRCPGFREHAECAYKIPVEIRTKEQLRATLTAMLEMQTSRVLFAKFAEELEGQGMDPALSAEMDRLFKLVEQFKDIEDSRDMITMTMEARGSAGVLSRIFGEKASEKANALSEPITDDALNQFIIDSEIIDE